MKNSYAVIINEQGVARMSKGALEGRLAVALINEGSISTRVAYSSDVNKLTAGYAVIGEHSEQEFHTIPLEEERQVLAAIAEAVRIQSDRGAGGVPAGFVGARETANSGVNIRLKNGGADIQISNLVIKEIGWQELERLSISSDPTGTTFAIHTDTAGAPLVANDSNTGRFYELERLIAAPLALSKINVNWKPITYWIHNGSLYFNVKQFEMSDAQGTAAPLTGSDHQSSKSEMPVPGWGVALLKRLMRR